jgi:putative cell wall-binding protein
VAALIGLLLVFTGISAVAPATAATGPQTIVSLTFDDSNADQLAPLTAMNALGLHGTLYTVSGFVGATGYLTQANLHTLAAAGNEIAGHTVNHPDLTLITPAEATQEVCLDRATLTGWGFAVTSFAYPFAAVNAAAETVVKDCGYNSARGLGDIETRFGCAGCGFAEAIPPADPFATRALDEVESTWTLADLQASVTNAEAAGGGWVQYTFHHICANVCDPLSVSPTVFAEFTQWLAARSATNNTVVKTVNEVIGGAVKPVVNATTTTRPAPGPGVNGVTNPSLEQAGLGALPSCWATGAFGVNTPTFSSVTPGHTGAVAEQLVMAGYTNGDAKLLQTMDLGTCASTVTPGHTYSLRAWYKSTIPTQFQVYLRAASGAWTVFWTASTSFAASADYTEAIWQTPVIPDGYVAISFGLNAAANGTLTTDDYALYDTVGAPAATGSLTGPPPTISGTPTVGAVLTAVTGTWAPAPVALTYQWLRGGTAIAGATASTYTLAAADSGTVITLQVTGTKAGFTTVSQTSTGVTVGTTTAGTPTVTATRLAGTDRFGTAVQISQKYAAGVPRAYVANGLNFPDALSASAAAAAFGGPLLLTQATVLPAEVRAELQRLAPAQILVAGGASVVSDGVVAQLQQIAPVVRLAGLDRYATSRAVAENAFATSGAATAYIATGANYPDALAASPAAAHAKGPVILVPGNAGTVDAATSALLTALHVTNVVIAGGTAVVSTGIENALKAMLGAANVTRAAGIDRYATAVLINGAFAASDASYLATGSNFADALAGAALAGSKNAPLFLSQTTCVPRDTVSSIGRLKSTQIVLLGGTAVLSARVESLTSCG